MRGSGLSVLADGPADGEPDRLGLELVGHPGDLRLVLETVRGRLQTYSRLPAFVDSLKQSATQCGAAYWDIYGAMGGENSMQAWGAAKPPLAGPDFIHFTLAGAKRVGEMFCDSFFLYYDYYRWRKEHEN